jgi:hypothetical protein
MEPDAKRPKLARVLAVPGNSLVHLTAAVEDLIYRMNEERSEKLRALRSLLPAEVRSTLFAGGDVDIDLVHDKGLSSNVLAVIEAVANAQNALIDEMFECMKEAAHILNVLDLCEFDRDHVLQLAKVISGGKKITKVQLVNYVRATVKYYLILHPTPAFDHSEAGQALTKYRNLRERIRSDKEAGKLIEEIWQGFKNAREFKVFSALCVPSGTGKTQLAFCMPDDCAVLYLNLAVANLNEDIASRQHIYKNFMGITPFMISKLEDDATKDKNSAVKEHLWIYGVVSALFELLKQSPDLNLPADLTRIEVVRDPGIDAQTFLIEPVSKLVCERSIKQFEEKGKAVLFFIDEFTAGTPGHRHDLLAFFRRKLINLGVCVTVASTDSGIVNMLNKQANTDESRGIDGAWACVCTRLPRYVPVKSLSDAVAKCDDENVRLFIQLCLRSRPLFAGEVADEIYTFLQSPSDADVFSLVERLRMSIVRVRMMKSSSFTAEGCYGYVVAMLTAGYWYQNKNGDEMKIYSNLCTNNWAYLVNEAALFNPLVPQSPALEEPAFDGSQGDVEESVSQDDDIVTGTIFEELDHSVINYSRHALNSTPIPHLTQLWTTLKRVPGGSFGDKLMFVDSKGGFQEFRCSTFFVKPDEDILFYLSVAGCVARPGLMVNDSQGSNVRISVANVVERTFAGLKRDLLSANAPMPLYQRHEMLVSAAFMCACNSGPLNGSSLEQLVTRFVAELLEVPGKDYVPLGSLDPINWTGQFEAQLMWPYDTEVLDGINYLLRMVESTRPPNSQMFDAGTYEKIGKKKSLKVLVEAKSTLRGHRVTTIVQNALRRLDSQARINFIVIDKTIAELKCLDLKQYRVLNRSEKDGKVFGEGGSLARARLFKVEISKNMKVHLLPLDGKRPATKGDRLIFLISREDINNNAATSDVIY